MKDFDLEKALNGTEVVTRDREKVTQLHLFRGDSLTYSLAGLINGTFIDTWTANGKYFLNEDSSYDLFLKD